MVFLIKAGPNLGSSSRNPICLSYTGLIFGSHYRELLKELEDVKRKIVETKGEIVVIKDVQEKIVDDIKQVVGITATIIKEIEKVK